MFIDKKALPFEICSNDLPRNARRSPAAKAAFLHKNSHDDLFPASLRRADEPRVIRSGRVLRRPSLTRDAHAGNVRRRPRARRDDLRHIAVDERGTRGRRRRPPHRRCTALERRPVRRDHGVHEIGLHDLAVICKGVRNQRHLEWRHENLPLTDADLRDLAVAELR